MTNIFTCLTNNISKNSKYFVILDIVGLDVSRIESLAQIYPNISSLFENDGEIWIHETRVPLSYLYRTG